MAESRVYFDRAGQLGFVRDFIREDDSYPEATALLAVHTAIALNDALLLELVGRRPRNPDHATAVQETETACRARKADHRGLKHLRTLLSKKTEVSYGDTPTTVELAKLLAQTSERFEEWALTTLTSLRRKT